MNSTLRFPGVLALSAAVACGAFVATQANAQCPDGWSTTFGNPGADNPIHAMINYDPDGPGPSPSLLVVGGSFARIGGNWISRIAAWNGSAWIPMGSGANETVRAFAVVPNASGGNDLIAAGSFWIMDGVSTPYIARWNGTAWSSIGAMNAPVWGLLATSNGAGGTDLIAGGDFNSAGGVTAYYIARWNGTSWSNLSNGMDQRVRGLINAPGGGFFATGNFMVAGGQIVNNIAHWNGTAWSPVGTGLGGSGVALAILPGGDLIVGGGFLSAGGSPASRIARWNGSSWAALGAGVSSDVASLMALPSGDLLVGGYFTSAGGASEPYLARYSAGAWSPFGGGTNLNVYSLLRHPGGDILVGGHFSAAGGITSNRIARYTIGAPAPVITTHPADVTNCGQITTSFTCIGDPGVSGSGLPGPPLTYAWRKNTVAINPLTNPSAATPTLQLPPAGMSNEGLYDCVVTNPCGSATSTPAQFTICIADFNCSGGTPDDADVSAFFIAWASGLDNADVNESGGTPDDADVAHFFNRWNAGC